LTLENNFTPNVLRGTIKFNGSVAFKVIAAVVTALVTVFSRSTKKPGKTTYTHERQLAVVAEMS
jgi:hypothetical protein